VAEDYPVLKHYLEKEKFKALMEDFVHRTQSHHFNVARYSTQLLPFLATHSAHDPFAYELATLENAMAQLFDAQETIALEPIHLTGMTPESLMELVLHPRAALQLFAFSHPVNCYYLAVMDEEAPPPPMPEETFLAVFRHEDVMWRMDLGENEYRLLQKLFADMPVGKALESLQNELTLPDHMLGTQLFEWFSRWMRNGLLAHYEYNVASPIRSIA
jgi:hypothetical protein